MKDFWILKVLDFWSWFYQLMGVDYAVMRKVLQIKLLMDQRRVPSLLMNYKHKEDANNFYKSLIIYGVFGLLIAAVVPMGLPLFVKMNLLFGMLIFMLTMTMVSDFSAILLDTKDKEILLAKPITPKTVSAAKITHILIYLTAITFSLAGASLLIGFLKYGLLFFGIFLIDLLLALGLVLFLTPILYVLILTMFDSDKLTDIINYFQIIFSLIMMIGSQFLGQIFKYIDINMGLVFKGWMYLLPTTWFAAPFSLLLEKKTEIHFIYLTIIGVLVPILLSLIYFGLVIKLLEKNLYKLDRLKISKGLTKEKRAKIYRNLIYPIIPNKLENVFCRFSQNMISSDRNIKLRLYPYLGFAALLPIAHLANRYIFDKSMNQVLTDTSQGAFYLLMYFFIAMLPTTATTINSSENYKGAWVYKALPINSPGQILVGALKGYILKCLMPIYLFLAVIFAIPYGPGLIPHLILILLNMLLLIILLFKFSLYELPFSERFEGSENNFPAFIAALLFCGISGAVHHAVRNVDVGLFIYIIAVLGTASFLWKTSAKITWKDV